ncbi:MAG: hypothetical protein K1X83_14515 [Oligoflexia bacterium]|nr:hypothetical protein [Oligoflexia bacterium]
MRNRIAALISLLLLLPNCTARALEQPPTITNYEQCVAAGNAIRKSFPPDCITADGQIFVDESAAAGQTLCVNKCGDGECQEIVCMGQGCPCPESSQTCPQDCKTH